MHITNKDQLKKQKRKLSLLFTIILFLVVISIQIIFLLGKYLDYSNKEFRRLDGAGFLKDQIMETMVSGNMMNRIPPMPMLGGEGKGWKLKGGNMIIYNKGQNRILSSSVGDEELTKEIIQEILKQGKDQGIIIYNKSRFLFSKEPLAGGNQGFLFVPAITSISDVISDILLFILFFGFCSVLFYYVIYWFVGRMFIPIQANIQDMEQFVFNAGHELKTPLSVIKSHLQLGLVKKTYKKSIDKSVEELDKMNLLLESLVNLSMINIDLSKEVLDLEKEIESVIGHYSQLSKDKGVDIFVKRDDVCPITANKSYVNMLLSNIISNAIKYNKKNGSIEIIISKGMISIKDTGIGIPSKDLTKIYDRFFQVGNVRNQEGFGIGLSLVKKIVDIYGWKIDVISQEKKGTTIVIKFL